MANAVLSICFNVIPLIEIGLVIGVDIAPTKSCAVSVVTEYCSLCILIPGQAHLGHVAGHGPPPLICGQALSIVLRHSRQDRVYGQTDFIFSKGGVIRVFRHTFFWAASSLVVMALCAGRPRRQIAIAL